MGLEPLEHYIITCKENYKHWIMGGGGVEMITKFTI